MYCFQILPPRLSSRWHSDATKSGGEAQELLVVEVLEKDHVQIDEDLINGGHVL